MKCKICGHRTNSLKAMREHYWSKHPDTMKRRVAEGRSKRKSRREARVSTKSSSPTYCPYCGKKL